jgi:predicted acyl esterase
MKQIRIFLLFGALILPAAALGQGAPNARAASASEVPQALEPAARQTVELKSPDGTALKGTYFAAAKPGPGVLLFHQSNRTRKAWDGVAGHLAAAGIHTLTIDMRGHGESGGR